MFASGRPEANIELLQTSIGERDPELAAVAFPVFTGQNRLLGALSLSGTCTRFSSQSHLQTLQQAVAQAAAEIEGLLLGQ